MTAKGDLWEVHRDPYDASRVWVRNHHDAGAWITVPWTHLNTAPAPFGDLAWDHARAVLARRGQDPVTETQIAHAVNALLDKAEHGPQGDGPGQSQPAADDQTKGQPKQSATDERKSRRVAARTRATSGQTSAWSSASQPASDRPLRVVVDADQANRDQIDVDQEDGVDLATVTPLPIFDAREEAKKWW